MYFLLNLKHLYGIEILQYGGYQSSSRWLQSLRMGYRRNLAGTEKTYISAGITAFRYFNFDLATALDTVSISDDKIPEGVILSLGFQVTF